MNFEQRATSTKHPVMLRRQKISFVSDRSACAHFITTAPKTYRTSQARFAIPFAQLKQESGANPLTRNYINGKQNAYRCRTPRRNSGGGFTGRPC